MKVLSMKGILTTYSLDMIKRKLNQYEQTLLFYKVKFIKLKQYVNNRQKEGKISQEVYVDFNDRYECLKRSIHILEDKICDINNIKLRYNNIKENKKLNDFLVNKIRVENKVNNIKIKGSIVKVTHNAEGTIRKVTPNYIG